MKTSPYVYYDILQRNSDKIIRLNPLMQEEIYRLVCGHFAPTGQTALAYEGQKVKKRPISSAQDPEGYERPAVEDHVLNIITELCKIRDVRNE